jgi:hypothetical protein
LTAGCVLTEGISEPDYAPFSTVPDSIGIHDIRKNP